MRSSQKKLCRFVACVLLMIGSFDVGYAGGYGGGGYGGYGGASSSASASASSFASAGSWGGSGVENSIASNIEASEPSGHYGGNPFLSGKGGGSHGLSLSINKEVNLNGVSEGITGLVGGILGSVHKLHGAGGNVGCGAGGNCGGSGGAYDKPIVFPGSLNHPKGFTGAGGLAGSSAFAGAGALSFGGIGGAKPSYGSGAPTCSPGSPCAENSPSASAEAPHPPNPFLGGGSYKSKKPLPTPEVTYLPPPAPAAEPPAKDVGYSPAHNSPSCNGAACQAGSQTAPIWGSSSKPSIGGGSPILPSFGIKKEIHIGFNAGGAAAGVSGHGGNTPACKSGTCNHGPSSPQGPGSQGYAPNSGRQPEATNGCGSGGCGAPSGAGAHASAGAHAAAGAQAGVAGYSGNGGYGKPGKDSYPEPSNENASGYARQPVDSGRSGPSNGPNNHYAPSKGGPGAPSGTAGPGTHGGPANPSALGCAEISGGSCDSYGPSDLNGPSNPNAHYAPANTPNYPNSPNPAKGSHAPNYGGGSNKPSDQHVPKFPSSPSSGGYAPTHPYAASGSNAPGSHSNFGPNSPTHPINPSGTNVPSNPKHPDAFSQPDAPTGTHDAPSSYGPAKHDDFKPTGSPNHGAPGGGCSSGNCASDKPSGGCDGVGGSCGPFGSGILPIGGFVGSGAFSGASASSSTFANGGKFNLADLLGGALGAPLSGCSGGNCGGNSKGDCGGSSCGGNGGAGHSGGYGGGLSGGYGGGLSGGYGGALNSGLSGGHGFGGYGSGAGAFSGAYASASASASASAKSGGYGR